MLKTVIFDFDGTIANTVPLCITAFRKAIEPLAGKKITDDEIMSTFGPSEEGTIMALIPDYYEQGLDSYLKYYKELHDMCPEPFEKITESIQYLRNEKIKVALVTGKGEKSCRISLDYYTMNNSFDIIKTGSPKGQRKTEGIKEVIEFFGINADEAIYIGDAVSDIQSSKRAGVPIISAMWGTFSNINEITRYNPNQIIFTTQELLEYLKREVKATS
ncbi:MAG: HAD family hydrolase [Velocimicrobium sp.]